MISSKYSLYKDLEQLQINCCQTDICLIGAEVFIHRAMLFDNHVEPHAVWYQLDPWEGDGQVLVIMPDTQTPLEPQTDFVDHSGMTKREKKQQLDMINVRLSLLKLQRNEALTNNDRETAMKVMRSIDQTQEEKQKLEDDLEASNISEEGSDLKDDVEDDNNNADADPESGEGSPPTIELD